MPIYYYYILVIFIILLFLKIDWVMCGIPYRKIDFFYSWIFKFSKQIDIKIFEENLLLFDDVMKQVGIPYWLSEGTALGVIRDGRLLPWDDDVDVAMQDVYYKIFLQKAVPLLEKRGFRVAVVWNDGYFISFIRKCMRVDVDIVSKGGNCMGPVTKNTNWSMSCDDMMKHIQYFKNVPFLGRTFTVPNETYFEYLYGKDWKNPVKGGTKMFMFVHLNIIEHYLKKISNM